MPRSLTHPPSVVTSAAAPSAAELALGMRRPSTPPPRPERAREAGQPIDRFVEQAVKRNIPARHVLLRAGEPRDVLFYMISGSAEVLVEDDQGKQMILVYLDKGHFLAPWSQSAAITAVSWFVLAAAAKSPRCPMRAFSAWRPSTL